MRKDPCWLHLPLSDGGVQPLPVTVLDGVVVVEVLLLVLLHHGAGRRLFGGENIRCHLLLLLAPQGDNFITDRGQLGAAAGIAFLGALTRLAFHRLWKHQEEGQTFHVPPLGIDHECVLLPSSGSARREDMHRGRAGAGSRGGSGVGGLGWGEGSSWTALSRSSWRRLHLSGPWKRETGDSGLTPGIPRHFSRVKFAGLAEGLSGFPSLLLRLLLLQSDETSSLDPSLVLLRVSS